MASYRFGKSVPAVFRAMLPVIIVLHIGVLLMTYVPWLTTFLPSVFAR
jgi:C4-dicarboxylate transporter, DctM subunit